MPVVLVETTVMHFSKLHMVSMFISKLSTLCGNTAESYYQVVILILFILLTDETIFCISVPSIHFVLQQMPILCLLFALGIRYKTVNKSHLLAHFPKWQGRWYEHVALQNMMSTQRSSQFSGGFGGEKSGGEDSVTDGFTEEGPLKRKSRYFVVTGSQFDIQHFQIQLQR